MANVDPDFFDVMGVDLIEGRKFSADRSGDFFKWGGDHIKIILNETAVKAYELESPVGYQETGDNGLTIEIIGVVKDFNFRSQHEKIEPCILVWGMYIGSIFIKIGPENMPSTLRYLKKEFESLFPYKVFNPEFLDETYNQQYKKDEQTAEIIVIFAIIAILIACLGLFGLASFMATKKTKEIGIRKAIGASERSVFMLMSKEFIRWVLLSVIIACPTGWYIMNRWLETYAYRTNVGIVVIMLAVITAFGITFLTVSWHSLRIARINPVNALRYE
jgi:putative ABC transport system permease protein